MLYPRDILFGLLLPVATSAIILAASTTRTFRRRPHWQSSLLLLSLTTAFMLSYALLYHLPPFPPTDTVHWLFYFPLPAAILGLLFTWPPFPRLLTSLLTAPLYLAFILALLHPIFQNISFPESAEITVFLTFAGLLSYLSLNTLAHRNRDTTIHFPLFLIIAATGQVLMMSATFTVGQTALILACALAGALPIVWWLSIHWSGGPLLLTLLLWHGFLIYGHYFSMLMPLNALLLAIAPHAAWLAETPRVQQWPKLPRTLIRLTAPIIPMATAQTLALLDFLKAQRGYPY
jgi:hypothetical protein